MADELSNGVKNLEISGATENSQAKKGKNEDLKALGFSTEELYKLALHFYRDKDGKGLHLTYKDKLKMVAYTKQVAHGKYTPGTSPDVGYFDVVGNDRKQAWIALGEMTKETAMSEFVSMIDNLCPLFKPYLEAQKAEKEQAEKKRKEEEEQRRKEEEERERKLLEEEAQRQLQMERQRQMEQERQIRAALNQQTAQQFKQYAEQQCPGNTKQNDENLIAGLQEQHFQQFTDQQEDLIAQLQEQHFQQYMQQVYQQQLLHQQQQYQQLQAMQAAQKTATTGTPPTAPPTSQPANNTLPNGPAPNIQAANGEQLQNGDDDGEGSVIVKDDNEDDLPPIAAASMWTRKDVKEFKDSLRKDKDAVIKVGSGETVTVRVPTHEDGSCLFWEFATDYYDIGFGVYFEWTIAPNNTVSVHVTESSDEEELEEEEGKSNDIEKGSKKDDKPPMDEIIPVYRRDCHEEVYCGSHAYPGRGVYLLKFDNSYSLWRSKTLYYRVYYSR